MYGEINWDDLPRRFPLKRQRIAEQAVLTHILSRRPERLTVAGLMDELGVKNAEEHGELEKAVDDLFRAGLLCGRENVIFPSEAALRFDELAL